MSHHSGSKKTPTSEIVDLRKQVADLKESAIARRRVEEALRAAESLHRSTLDEAPAGIVRLDGSGRVLYANPAFIRLLGYDSRQDFNTIGQLRGVFLNAEEARRVVELSAASATEVVARCLRRDGQSEALRLLVGGAGVNQGVTLVHPETVRKSPTS
jgi:PAS domain-containing protein